MSVVKNFILKQGSFELRIDKLDLLDQGVTALCGPSGSGKSSFAKALLGLKAVESGQWLFKTNQGQMDLLGLPPEMRHLGVVFQDFALFPHMTAEQNIMFAARARSINSQVSKDKLDYFVDVLSMSGFLKTKAGKISGGEAQRVALARALMGHPRFLILDEAFASLDQDNKARAHELCKKVLSDTKTPALLISHDIAEVEAFADQKVLIDSGRLIN